MQPSSNSPRFLVCIGEANRTKLSFSHWLAQIIHKFIVSFTVSPVCSLENASSLIQLTQTQSPWISIIKINYFSSWCPSLGRSNQPSEGHGGQGEAVLRLQAVLNPKSRPQVKLWVICTKNPKRLQAPAFSQVEVLPMLDGSAWNGSIWFLESICKMENCDSGEAKTFETTSLRWICRPCHAFGFLAQPIPTTYHYLTLVTLYVSISVTHPYMNPIRDTFVSNEAASSSQHEVHAGEDVLREIQRLGGLGHTALLHHVLLLRCFRQEGTVTQCDSVTSKIK